MVLWAVDGLAGVVLEPSLLGSPRGAAAQAASARRLPRAVVWGQHTETGSWLSGIVCLSNKVLVWSSLVLLLLSLCLHETALVTPTPHDGKVAVCAAPPDSLGSMSPQSRLQVLDQQKRVSAAGWPATARRLCCTSLPPANKRGRPSRSTQWQRRLPCRLRTWCTCITAQVNAQLYSAGSLISTMPSASRKVPVQPVACEHCPVGAAE